MACVFLCDRCAHQGQLTTILGKDICAACVAELRTWLGLRELAKAGKIVATGRGVFVARKEEKAA